MQRTSSDTWWRIMSAMLGFIETSLAGSPMRVLLRERTGFRIGPNIKRPRSGRVLKVRRSHGGAELFRVARLWRWSRTLTCRLEAKLHCCPVSEVTENKLCGLGVLLYKEASMRTGRPKATLTLTPDEHRELESLAHRS